MKRKNIFLEYVIETAQVVEILPYGSTYLSCIVNTMSADDVVTQGARASAAMVVTSYPVIFRFQYQRGYGVDCCFVI